MQSFDLHILVLEALRWFGFCAQGLALPGSGWVLPAAVSEFPCSSSALMGLRVVASLGDPHLEGAGPRGGGGAYGENQSTPVCPCQPPDLV